MGLKYYQMAERCITVLYLMSGGDEHAELEKEEFYRQCNELKVFDMSDEQFKRFKQERVNVGQMAQQGDIWRKNH